MSTHSNSENEFRGMLSSDEEERFAKAIWDRVSVGEVAMVVGLRESLVAERKTLIMQSLRGTDPFESQEIIERALSGLYSVDLGQNQIELISLDQRIEIISNELGNLDQNTLQLDPNSVILRHPPGSRANMERFLASNYLIGQDGKHFDSFAQYETWWDEEGILLQDADYAKAISGSSIMRSVYRCIKEDGLERECDTVAERIVYCERKFRILPGAEGKLIAKVFGLSAVRPNLI